MEKALRWGILSAGLIAHDFTTALRSLPRSEHQVVAVAARDLARAQDFARKHEIPKSYGSYTELTKDPEVDVVYVAVQHPQHLGAVLQCLAASKPVLCEKPLGVTAAEVREMVAAARARGLFLMEAIWTRFFPAAETLRSLLCQGALGELRVVRMDFGIDGVDDTVTAILQYPGGLQASFSCSITTELSNSLSVYGTKGKAEIPSTMWCPTELVVNGKKTEFPLPKVADAETFNYLNSIGMVYEAQHVRQCLLQGLKESPVMPLAESELLADILEEARRQIGLRFLQDRT
ncbi:trans-1,2-dihydrobenzene-1,2-diol dehydrogenase isoform X2 [Petaurus breviceps papuanus]|uniref:trans-1,2-dihydrobenzene-1,2-diol dehydrogenase isoform X2 n=1 Tax=Petaurus breviceps papuanus TaxID=3040969 RepID=UPI0036DE972E